MSRPDDLDDVCAYYRKTRLSEAEIRSARELIARTWVASSPSRRADFDALASADLDYLFALYDEHFFAGAFMRKIRASGNELQMVPSKMLSKTAGRCAYDPARRKRKCAYTIEIATNILRDAFAPRGAPTGAAPAAPAYAIGGRICRSRLECMQLTLEHEMVHLLMYVWQECNDPLGNRTTRRTVNNGLVVGGHGKTFKRLILHIFGHTAIYPGLFTSVTFDEKGDVVRPAGSVRLLQKLLPSTAPSAAPSGITRGMHVVVRGKRFKVVQCHPKTYTAVDESGALFKIRYGAEQTQSRTGPS